MTELDTLIARLEIEVDKALADAREVEDCTDELGQKLYYTRDGYAEGIRWALKLAIWQRDGR